MLRLLFPFGVLLLSLTTSFAQTISWELLANTPERVSNNAVCTASADGINYVYTFSGIDSTKSCNGDHLRAYRYNPMEDNWETLADLPDPLGGKIAAGASTVKNKIYIIGGYHLASNCAETSSAKVHIFDPISNTYEADGAPIPRSIDDQAQAVWRDSLIYVISGWSNTNNVRDVQIYNPTTDAWMTGTSVPNNSNWRTFGASGCIIGDTIYLAGGAGNWNGSNFPPTQYFRKGVIDPNNPTSISWLDELRPLARGYRMGAESYQGEALWFGGSQVTYNFDGIAYNGTGGVAASDRILVYRPSNGALEAINGLMPPIMDLRGVAAISENEFVLVGGMIENQMVTNRVVKITIDDLTEVQTRSNAKFSFYPNPSNDKIYFNGKSPVNIRLISMHGTTLLAQQLDPGSSLDIRAIPSGFYLLRYIDSQKREGVQKVIIK